MCPTNVVDYWGGIFATTAHDYALDATQFDLQTEALILQVSMVPRLFWKCLDWMGGFPCTKLHHSLSAPSGFHHLSCLPFAAFLRPLLSFLLTRLGGMLAGGVELLLSGSLQDQTHMHLQAQVNGASWQPFLWPLTSTQALVSCPEEAAEVKGKPLRRPESFRFRNS